MARGLLVNVDGPAASAHYINLFLNHLSIVGNVDSDLILEQRYHKRSQAIQPVTLSYEQFFSFLYEHFLRN